MLTTNDSIYNYHVASAQLKWIMDDLRALSGDTVGPSGSSWQDIADALAQNLRQYADSLGAAVAGRVVRGPAVFPSPDDV